jgi:multidrug resistance efflux pump
MDGVLEEVAVERGQLVRPGDLLARLSNEESAEAVAQASAQVAASRIRTTAYEATNAAKALQEREIEAVYREELQRRQSDVADLSVRAAGGGIVVDGLRAADIGRYIRRGDPIAVVGEGRWEVRALFTEDQVATAHPEVGQTVAVRVAAFAERTLAGTVTRITPGGLRHIAEQPLTHLGGGRIVVDPSTSLAEQTFFEVRIALTDDALPGLRHDMTCEVCFRGDPTTLGTSLVRRFLRFANKLMQR